MDYNKPNKSWAEGFSRGARGESREGSQKGLLDKVKSVFSATDKQSEALKRRAKQTAHNSADSDEQG